MYTLHISNKNYSSNSLRVWMLMRQLDIEFNERLHLLGTKDEYYEQIGEFSPSGKYPCLISRHGLRSEKIWDAFAIIEYLAERHDGVWPQDASARAWARSIVAEQHAGFKELETVCSMSCGHKIKLHYLSPKLLVELRHILRVWNEGLRRFNGPYLMGKSFTAVDAYFAPMIFRIHTYGLEVDKVSMQYYKMALRHKFMQQWYQESLLETDRDVVRDTQLLVFGDVEKDSRLKEPLSLSVPNLDL